jgi:hypothetical protein
VEVYNFTVVDPPAFELAKGTERTRVGPAFTDPTTMAETFYAVGDTYQVAPLTVLDATNFSTADGSRASLQYALVGNVPAGMFVKTSSGEILATFAAADANKAYTVNLTVADVAGESALLETIEFKVRYRDVADPANKATFGPNKKVCAHGVAKELKDVSDEFDGVYECDCNGTQYDGANCEDSLVLLNCADNSTLVEGRCEIFELDVDKAGRIQKRRGTYTDPVAMNGTFYAVNESYRVAPFGIRNTTTPSTGNMSDITYTLGVGTSDNFFLSTTSGEIFWRFEEVDADKTYTITLIAVDKGGAKQIMETMVMRVRAIDVDVPGYGPNNRTCLNNGRQIDAVKFDQSYTCNCSGTTFTGPNCEVASEATGTKDTGGFFL